MPLIIIVAIVGALLVAGGSKVMGNKFADTYRAQAQLVYSEYGIPVNISLAQWAHETGSGTGKIFLNTWNFGSITAQSWCNQRPDGSWVPKPGYESRVYISDTTEYDKNGKPYVQRRPFRKYSSPDEGALDWAAMLANSSRFPERYAAARTGNLLAFANALQKTGYATDPGYAQKIVKNYGGIA